jgi:hypothetical protein
MPRIYMTLARIYRHYVPKIERQEPPRTMPDLSTIALSTVSSAEDEGQNYSEELTHHEKNSTQGEKFITKAPVVGVRERGSSTSDNSMC